MKWLMVRRSAPSRRSFIYWFGAPIAVLFAVACNGLWTTNSVVSPWFSSPGCPSNDDGSLAIPIECCPCPWADMCPNGWPPVPEYCRTGCEPGEPHECCLCPTPEWCTEEANQTYIPPDWCKDKPWRDAGADASPDGASAICPIGTCVPKTPEGWSGPATVQEGFEAELEKCPEGAIEWQGSTKPEAPGCAECACSTPKSVCGSAPKWTISSRGCGEFDLGVKWNYDPPANWDGSCLNEKALPEGAMCGAEGLCAKSILISPPELQMIDTTCTPSTKEDPMPVPKLHADSAFTPIARVCLGKQLEETGYRCGVDDQDLCLSVPDTNLACIARDGDHACPSGWPVRSIYYRNVNDNRTCTACSCGPVEGANCIRKYRLFEDGLCTNEYGSWTSADTGLPQCQYLIGNPPIGGKTLETIEHTPGACKPSGGELVGEVELKDPFTICCAHPTM